MGWLLSYSFDDTKDDDKNIEIKEEKRLQQLKDEFVYCPKCGKKNSFATAPNTQTTFFCQRCQARISKAWERYQNGKLSLVSCKFCKQPTFNTLKFCVACGAKQGEYKITDEFRELAEHPDQDGITKSFEWITGTGRYDHWGKAFRKMPKKVQYTCIICTIISFIASIIILILVTVNID